MVDKKKKYLFIEGTQNENNGNLRKGFSKLLSQKLQGNMPQIIMGNNTNSTIKKYLNSPESRYLLIDLDAPASAKEAQNSKYGLAGNAGSVFYMIQKMEAWFLSQPGILDEYYKSDISKKIKGDAGKIDKPCACLENLTKSTPRGKYHKVKHGTELLEKLDAAKLAESFEDFALLIQELQK